MTERTPPDRSLPREITDEVHRIEIEASQCFQIRRFEQSRRLYEQILDLMRRTQTQLGRPIHKGAPLHMIGLCYTMLNQHNNALKYILLAYIEDTLNVNFGLEDEADGSPAARMLRDYYGLQIPILRSIKQIALESKRSGEWASITDPETILRRLDQVDTNKLTNYLTHEVPHTPERQPFGFPQPWERRVFVGGNYQSHMPIIRHIERVVGALGYTPIVALDVDIPREQTHHHTMLLLHTCGFGIFEISTPAGQLMEIERADDYGTQILLLYSAMSQDAPPSPQVSSMVRTMGAQLVGYNEPDELVEIIGTFLPHPTVPSLMPT